MKKTSTQILVEGAAMLTLATILSFIKVFRIPGGGSVTLVSMLPVIVFSIKYGVKNGLFVSFSYAVVQLLQGFMEGTFSFAGMTTKMLVSSIFLDYILAFSVLGLAGVFGKKKTTVCVAGTIMVLFLRFVCHFVSGVVVWKTIGELWTGGFTVNNVITYSLLYNGVYMLPEIIFTAMGTYILFTVPQTRKILAQQ